MEFRWPALEPISIVWHFLRIAQSPILSPPTPAALTACRSVPLVALQAQVVFPLRSVATRDDSMYGTDGHETRRLGAESRLDKPRDSLVRDGVTRRVREAAFFFSFSVARRVLRGCSRTCQTDPPCRCRTWITDTGLAVTRRRGREIRQIGQGAVPAASRPTSEKSGDRRLSRERRNIPTACTPRGTLF